MVQDSSREPNGLPAELLEIKNVLQRSWVSPQQVADLLGAKYNTVMHWIRDQKLQGTRVNGRWRIDSEQLRDFLRLAGYTDALEEAEAIAKAKAEHDAAQGIRPPERE